MRRYVISANRNGVRHYFDFHSSPRYASVSKQAATVFTRLEEGWHYRFHREELLEDGWHHVRKEGV